MAAGARRAAHRAPAFVLGAEELRAGFAGVQLAQAWVSAEHGAAFPLGTWSPCSDKVGAALARGEGAAAVVLGEPALRWTLAPKKTRARCFRESLKIQN